MTSCLACNAQAWSHPPVPGAPAPPPPGPLLLGPLLPSGDQILSVQVTVAPPPPPQSGPGPQPGAVQQEQQQTPRVAADAAEANGLHQQPHLRFIVDLPAAPTAPTAAAAGAGRSPAPRAPPPPPAQSPLRTVTQPTLPAPDSDGDMDDDDDGDDSVAPSRDVTHGGEATAAGGVPQYPDLPTPPASPARAGGGGSAATAPVYSLQMALKRAERVSGGVPGRFLHGTLRWVPADSRPARHRTTC